MGTGDLGTSSSAILPLLPNFLSYRKIHYEPRANTAESKSQTSWLWLHPLLHFSFLVISIHWPEDPLRPQCAIYSRKIAMFLWFLFSAQWVLGLPIKISPQKGSPSPFFFNNCFVISKISSTRLAPAFSHIPKFGCLHLTNNKPISISHFLLCPSVKP